MHVEKRARWKVNAATSPDREMIPEPIVISELRLGGDIENEHQRGFAAALAFDSRILGPKHSNCQRDGFFLPKAGFIRILSPGKPGTPPCKSGQLEKDLELEASSVRQASRLIIFEIMI